MSKPIKTTKASKITGRIFTLNNLQNIAKIFAIQQSLAEKSDHSHSVEYKIDFDDGSTLESSSSEVVSDEFFAGPARPTAVSFSYFNLKLDRRMLFSASQGKAYSNAIKVSSSESAWVNNQYSLLTREIAATQPQSRLLHNHSFLIINILAFGIGSVIYVFSVAVAAVLAKNTDLFKSLASISTPQVVSDLISVLKYFLMWIAGMPYAFDLKSKLDDLWPDVELDIGEEHLKKEKLRRNTYKVLILVLITPLLISAIYDLLKLAMNGSQRPDATSQFVPSESLHISE